MSDAIPRVALVATELRAIADALDTLASTPLTRLYVTLQIQPSGADDDGQKIATIDAIGMAVVGKPGAVEPMIDGRSWHHDASGTRGPVGFSVYSSVTPPAERERLAEVAQLRAELDDLKAQRALDADRARTDES